jgi:very-short-patch-repair endonuclease
MDAEIPEIPTSIFSSDLPPEMKLERARTELLDLSARNRLLNIPRSSKSAKIIEVVDEMADEVYRLLVTQQRTLTFLAGKVGKGAIVEADDDEIADLEQPDDDGTDERGIANRHADTKLQTRLTPAGLQKRLLDLYYDARTLEEEQGVNILFLALGTLTWIDPNNQANVRTAPLVLIPVALERGNAGEKFKLKWRLEDPAANLSLEAYLDRIHEIKSPTFDPAEGFSPSKYADAMAAAVEAKPGWSVNQNDIVLGFFSFAKFLMYRDLDPANWPDGGKLSDHPIVRPLVSAEGFAEGEPLIDEDADLDAHITPAEMVHIVDSDSSQSLAVHEVRRGRNLVIQGPPGTGKSQTIANVIGSAIADGKTVLFVAEKMAALEVVKRRLDNTGVGDACLELHSNKANKRAVLEELRRTWELGAPRGAEDTALHRKLQDARDVLNAHPQRLHASLGPSGLTPYQVMGQLARLRREGQRPADLEIKGDDDWSHDDFKERHTTIVEVAERIDDIGTPVSHLWNDVDPGMLLPSDIVRLTDRIAAIATRLDVESAAHVSLAKRLEEQQPASFAEIDPLHELAVRVAGAPDLDAGALEAAEWGSTGSPADQILTAGATHSAIAEKLLPTFRPEAWTTDVSAVVEAFKNLPVDIPASAFGDAAKLADAIPKLLASIGELATIARIDQPSRTIADISRVELAAAHAAKVPSADTAALRSSAWAAGPQQGVDLADAVATLDRAKSEIGDGLTDDAWTTELGDARRILASRGTGILRFLSGEWREASRLVRSVSSDPKATLELRLAHLDALARGKRALATIADEDAFGADAFGAAWRGPRTAPGPVKALAHWMNEGAALGEEPRRIAALQPDQRRLAAAAATVRSLVEEVANPLDRLWQATASERATLFGSEKSASLADLNDVLSKCLQITDANAVFGKIALTADEDVKARCDGLQALVSGQAASRTLTVNADLGETLFGKDWRGEGSDWDKLGGAARWIGANLDIHQLAARVVEMGTIAQDCQAAIDRRESLLGDIGTLLGDLQAGPAAAVTQASIRIMPINQLSRALNEWSAGGEHLSKWLAYRTRATKARESGLGSFVDALETGSLVPSEAIGRFETSWYEGVYAQQVRLDPELAQFDGDLHQRTVSTFADMDRFRIRQASVEVVRAHHRRIPSSVGGALGPLGVLKGEIARKRGHMPIRQLISKAAPAVQALKPVFMMSPLSVAQFLPPGVLQFDLLVMDEASQIQPVDALGAIARAKQVVVVGDQQQLPPTAFFAKMTGAADDAEERDGTANVADIESILGLFTARGLPSRMLRWHYRSRHQSLIAVSNKQFYENKLFIVPSPYTAEAGMGLRFHHIPNGIFETGTTRTNPIEAEVVARAIVNHAIENPDQSLGVAAFSASQRRAILDRLELLRRALPPEHEAFFQSHPAEPFFVKNLENVQGDERDVILISVGYGPTAPGLKPPMRFGPVGQDGGERRLNVLISRAKRRCEVFASMTDEDIETDFASSRKGVFALKMFMHFARTGRMEMSAATGRDHDSVFEEQVSAALQERGYQVHSQVGIAGFFIDIAVSDEAHADRYLVGIECDGASYHSARSARDRDRLRQAILEDHGWIIHRIWSTDWFQRPGEQLERVIATIERAKVERAAEGSRQSAKAKARLEIVSIEREDVTEMGLQAIAASEPVTRPYVEAELVRPSHVTTEIHDTPTGIITALAEQVVAAEGPVHIDEIINRIRDAWGLKRAGGRIQDAVERGIAVAVRQGRVIADGWFYELPGAMPTVRDRSAARSMTLKKAESLPPSEIKSALVEVAARNFGATEEQILVAVARALGLKAMSAQIRSVLASVLTKAVDEGQLARRGNLLEVGPAAPARVSLAVIPTEIETLIAQGEGERLEFKQTLRWDVVQGAPNKKLEDVAVKTIAAFANRAGGTLLIGVRDDGTATGLDRDLACLGGNLDKFELHLTSILGKHFTQAFRASRIRVSFPSIGEVVACRIDVERARAEVYVTTADRNGALAERFFVRSGNSSQELRTSEVAAYVAEHFPR